MKQENQEPSEWVPVTLKEHVARVKDIELLTGITFFPKFYSVNVNAAIRFKLRLPQFTSEWLIDFLSTVPPTSSTLSGSAPNILSLSCSLQILLTVFWTFLLTKL